MNQNSILVEPQDKTDMTFQTYLIVIIQSLHSFQMLKIALECTCNIWTLSHTNN